jgi:hypothetical protein
MKPFGHGAKRKCSNKPCISAQRGGRGLLIGYGADARFLRGGNPSGADNGPSTQVPDRRRRASLKLSGETRRMTETDAMLRIEPGQSRRRRETACSQLCVGWLPDWRRFQPSLWPRLRPHPVATLRRRMPSSKSIWWAKRQLLWLHPGPKRLCPSRARQAGSSLAGPLQRCTAGSKRPERRKIRQLLPLSPS